MSDNFAKFSLLQTEWGYLLLSDAALAAVNIITRDFIIANESRLPDQTLAAEVLAYITPRNDKKGAGVIIERPVIRVPQGVSPGPQKLIAQTFLVLEDKLANESPASGTLLPADWIAQRILLLCQGQYIEGVGEFFADANAVQDAPEFEPLRAYRVTVLCNLQFDLFTRLTAPAIAAVADTVTLTNDAATPDAAIYYTTDGSLPGSANPAATLYSEPVPITVVTTFRWAAFQDGYLPSAIGKATITPA